jgi:virulence factor Mce-like protein
MKRAFIGLRPRLRIMVLVAALVSVVATGGCAFDPSAVPIPGTTVGGPTYPVKLQFSNVLNLPTGAKVIANGIEVGNLTGVAIQDPSETAGSSGHVVVSVAIKRSVRLPTTTTAELRQATPLGDVHMALSIPTTGSLPELRSGDTIPLSQTSQAPQVEDTLAGLATAVGSGAIGDIQDTVRQLNAVLPQDPAVTARSFGVLGNDFDDVAANLHTVDQLLDGLQATAGTIIDDQEITDNILTDQGVEHTAGVINSVVQVLYVFSSLGPVAHSALWLAPLVNSLDKTAKAVVPVLFTGNPLDLDTPSNLSRAFDLLQDKLIPFATRGPKVDLVGIGVDRPATGTASRSDQMDQIVKSLRMVGVIR